MIELVVTNAHGVVADGCHSGHEDSALFEEPLRGSGRPVAAVHHQDILLSDLLVHRPNSGSQPRQAADERGLLSPEPSRRPRLRLAVDVIRVQDHEVSLDRTAEVTRRRDPEGRAEDPSDARDYHPVTRSSFG